MRGARDATAGCIIIPVEQCVVFFPDGVSSWKPLSSHTKETGTCGEILAGTTITFNFAKEIMLTQILLLAAWILKCNVYNGLMLTRIPCCLSGGVLIPLVWRVLM